MEEVERKTVHISVCEKRAVVSLQAQHFCQQWHLYLLNALLMPRHVCCCKLLLRPILEDEVKGTGVATRVLWFCPGSFLMGKGRISGSSSSLVCPCLSSCLSVFLLNLLLYHFIQFFYFLRSSMYFMHPSSQEIEKTAALCGWFDYDGYIFSLFQKNHIIIDLHKIELKFLLWIIYFILVQIFLKINQFCNKNYLLD